VLSQVLSLRQLRSSLNIRLVQANLQQLGQHFATLAATSSASVTHQTVVSAKWEKSKQTKKKMSRMSLVILSLFYFFPSRHTLLDPAPSAGHSQHTTGWRLDRLGCWVKLWLLSTILASTVGDERIYSNGASALTSEPFPKSRNQRPNRYARSLLHRCRHSKKKKKNEKRKKK
jgi:hypothetical protein